MANEPKLWAVFGPDGKLVTKAHSDEWSAWEKVTRPMSLSLRKRREVLESEGYTCREVRIVPVEEPRTIPGTRITVGQMLAQIAEMGSVDEFASRFNLDTTTVRECLLRLSDEVGK